jgi:uncharacterized protein (TIGR00245 family)
MPTTGAHSDASIKLAVLSAAAGRMRVQTTEFQFDAGRAVAIEDTVAKVTGVRAVRAYPRTASVVIWYSPTVCDTAAVLSAIADAQHTPAAPLPGHRLHSAAIGNGGIVGKLVGGIAQTLMSVRRDVPELPPQIQRLQQALNRIGYHLEPANGSPPSPGEKVRRRRGTWARRVWLAVPLGLLVSGLTLFFGAHSWVRSLASAHFVAGRPFARGPTHRRSRSSIGVAMAMSALSVPSWGGVAVSLLLVAVAAAVAYRQRLRLTRELVVAAVRAGVQLVTVGAILLVLFQRAGLLGAAGWLVVMVVIAGQVAGRRGAGLPRAKLAGTVGVATGSVLTLAALLAGRVIAAQARVIVPVGGMIVSAAMLAAGIALRRLREQADQARSAIEARLSLGQSARQALLPHQQSALRTALLPAIDSTKVVGLISLPGAMTGLILAGVNPLTAIRYQIVVMYMLLAATALSALTAARLAERAMFDDAQRLLPIPQPSEPP